MPTILATWMTNRRSARMLLGLAGWTALALTGCGSDLASVTGKITLDQQPLAGGSDMRGTVCFYPEGGAGAPAIGLVDSNGQYSVSTGSRRGILPGNYLVSVAATEIIPPKSPGEAPGGRPLTPRRYGDPSQSGLRAEVKPGDNTFDFALSSK